jgi:L-rhamnose isomerase
MKKTSTQTQAVDPTSFRFELGSTVRDIITSFEGVVTGRCQYLTGCTQYLVQPRGTAKAPAAESRWLDEAKLSLVPGKKRVELNATPNGGPQRLEPPRH